MDTKIEKNINEKGDATPPVRGIGEILASGQTKTIRLDAIDDLSDGYSGIRPLLTSMVGILPDQQALSPWAAESLSHLIPPVLTPTAAGTFQIVFGLRQIVSVVATNTLDKVTARIVKNLSDEELAQFAHLDTVGVTLQIAVRPDGNGVGQIIHVFSRENNSDSRRWMEKMLPGVTSKSGLQRLLGITANNSKKKEAAEAEPLPNKTQTSDVTAESVPSESSLCLATEVTEPSDPITLDFSEAAVPVLMPAEF